MVASLAYRSMMVWFTLQANQFQLRQPMGGSAGRATPAASSAAAVPTSAWHSTAQARAVGDITGGKFRDFLFPAGDESSGRRNP